MVSLEHIRRRLTGRTIAQAPFVAEPSRAAVALILSQGEEGVSLAFILRAEREGDPWSAHVAFPGGRAGAGDTAPRQVAERETWEEVGLRLEEHHFVAPLEEVDIVRVAPGMRLSPFVYVLDGTPPPFQPNHEVAEAFWVSLARLTDPAHALLKEVEWNGQRYAFPAIRVGNHVLWGVTWRLLLDFARQVGLEIPVPAGAFPPPIA
ncbi:MAG: CoA pyrophosphatase [Deltaproteobacteria bacterium]|nr:CoA pyrophosphatase [Deltaproteobacteria bacterium]